MPDTQQPLPPGVTGGYSQGESEGALGVQASAQAVTDSRCTYLARAGGVCNKCGRIHDGKPNSAVPFVPRGVPGTFNDQGENRG